MSGSWGHCQSGVCSLTLDSGDDFRGGVEMVVTMFTVIRGRIVLCWTWSCRVLWWVCLGLVIRWVFVIVSVRCMGGFM